MHTSFLRRVEAARMRLRTAGPGLSGQQHSDDTVRLPEGELAGQGGFSLIETLLVVTFVAILIAGALAMYASTRATNNATQMVRDVVGIQAGLTSLYTGQNDYTDLSNEVLYNAKKIPASLIYSDGTIMHNEGGTITVAGDGTQYTITVTNVSSATCNSMLPAINTGFTGVSVDSTAVVSSAAEFPVTVAQASNACGSDTAVTIVYTGGTETDSGN